MKQLSKTLLITGLAVAAVSTLLAKSSPKHSQGTDIFHLSISKAAHNEGVETNATAKVKLVQHLQGGADQQKLEIVACGLTTNVTYQLLALVDDETNLVPVVDFMTDAFGRAAFRFSNATNGNGNGNGQTHSKKKGKGHGHGHDGDNDCDNDDGDHHDGDHHDDDDDDDGDHHGDHHGCAPMIHCRGAITNLPLPDALFPVSSVRELAIFNGSTQAVLTADLTAPDKLQYLVKRDLSNSNNVAAQLRIKATAKKAQFALCVSGLVTNADYFLVLNEEIVQTNHTGVSGKLKISSQLPQPAEILDLQSVALWDGASNVVVSTHLP